MSGVKDFVNELDPNHEVKWYDDDAVSDLALGVMDAYWAEHPESEKTDGDIATEVWNIKYDEDH